ncbi:MAG: type II toxin-antitoxin system HipA family toxin [Campylobacterota bacterium]|nr:type II toxin-antitoxin system HipA family toxin [Campylobacterota bacterium]
MKIYVIKNGLDIGYLTQSEENRKVSFIYLPDRDYILQGLKSKENTSDTLFPIFENLLPEHQYLDIIKARYSIKLEIETLLYLEDIHGSFEFYTEEDYQGKSFSEIPKLIFNECKNEILNNNYVFPNILNDYNLKIGEDILYPEELKHSKLIGISGFQYKFSIELDSQNKTIEYDATKNSEYFMKPYSEYYTLHDPLDRSRSYIPFLLINEHIFMTIARDLGFDIPYNAIIKGKDDYHYIIKRYDRHKESRIDHHELLTLLEKKSDQKYKVTMQEVLLNTKSYITQNELYQLFKFIVYSVIIAHGDLHAKNLSLIFQTNDLYETKMQLAPLYDISTTAIYQELHSRNCGMKIKNKTSKINTDDLLWLCEKLELDKKKSIEIIDEVACYFLDNFLQYIDKLPPEIKTLKFKRKRYGFDTLEATFDRFYNKRCRYINDYLDIDTTQDIFD